LSIIAGFFTVGAVLALGKLLQIKSIAVGAPAGIFAFVTPLIAAHYGIENLKSRLTGISYESKTGYSTGLDSEGVVGLSTIEKLSSIAIALLTAAAVSLTIGILLATTIPGPISLAGAAAPGFFVGAAVWRLATGYFRHR